MIHMKSLALRWLQHIYFPTLESSTLQGYIYIYIYMEYNLYHLELLLLIQV